MINLNFQCIEEEFTPKWRGNQQEKKIDKVKNRRLKSIFSNVFFLVIHTVYEI